MGNVQHLSYKSSYPLGILGIPYSHSSSEGHGWDRRVVKKPIEDHKTSRQDQK